MRRTKIGTVKAITNLYVYVLFDGNKSISRIYKSELCLMGDGLCGACKAQVYNPAKKIKIDKRSRKYEEALISFRERKWPEKFGGGKCTLKK
jgi:hypothetical protein